LKVETAKLRYIFAQQKTDAPLSSFHLRAHRVFPQAGDGKKTICSS
jgi:hypothetical protein